MENSARYVLLILEFGDAQPQLIPLRHISLRPASYTAHKPEHYLPHTLRSQERRPRKTLSRVGPYFFLCPYVHRLSGLGATTTSQSSKGASIRRAGTLIRSPMEGRNKDKDKTVEGELRASEVGSTYLACADIVF